jgi:hypothetical protein
LQQGGAGQVRLGALQDLRPSSCSTTSQSQVQPVARAKARNRTRLIVWVSRAALV